jgi:hypothetical protein
MGDSTLLKTPLSDWHQAHGGTEIGVASSFRGAGHRFSGRSEARAWSVCGRSAPRASSELGRDRRGRAVGEPSHRRVTDHPAGARASDNRCHIG